MQNGKESGVPAWGNRTAIRVPSAAFKEIFTRDKKLSQVIQTIETKNQLLDMQANFNAQESVKLATELQSIIDKTREFKIIPKTLDGFYRACFLMEKIKQYPTNNEMWLVFGASFYSKNLSSYEFARLIYALDFLYGGSGELQPNTLKSFVEMMKKTGDYLAIVQRNNLQTCSDLSPNEEVINFLFAANLYEDIVQELRVLYDVNSFKPIHKIFQTIQDADLIARMTDTKKAVNDQHL